MISRHVHSFEIQLVKVVEYFYAFSRGKSEKGRFRLEWSKITFMGRKGPRANTKTVLKTVSLGDQLGSMPKLRFSTLSK